MLKFNHEKIKEKNQELTQFKGWLPFRLGLYVDSVEREKYLKSEGLYEKIEQANQDYKRLLRSHEAPQRFMEELVLEFIQDNPQFKEILL